MRTGEAAARRLVVSLPLRGRAYGTGIGPGESRSSRSSLVLASWDVAGSDVLSVVNEREGSEGRSASDVGTGRPYTIASMPASARPSRRSTPPRACHMSRRYPPSGPPSVGRSKSAGMATKRLIAARRAHASALGGDPERHQTLRLI